VPIIPVAYRSKRGRSNTKRWDQIYQVRKFDQIEVFYGSPILLNPSQTDSEAMERVQNDLDELSQRIGKP
jgi:lysophospholipid acyltransferase (LPLAT)-like uncharacterized protein